MVQHSFLPWHVEYGQVVNLYGDVVARRDGSDDNHIPPTQRDANMHYIATACNAFPALVESLAELTDRFERLEALYFQVTKQTADGENGSVVRARKALQSAAQS